MIADLPSSNRKYPGVNWPDGQEGQRPSAVLYDQKDARSPVRCRDGMCHVRCISGCVAWFEPILGGSRGQNHAAFQDGQLFASAGRMRLTDQRAAGSKADVIDLMTSHILRRREDGDRAMGGFAVDHWHIARAQHVDPICGFSGLEETCEIHLEGTSEVPERCDGW